MAGIECSSFTSDDKYFGSCGLDGKLKIWDTTTGSLKQEFTPNLHLQTPLTCLTWIVTSRNHVQTPSKTSKRKSLEKSREIGINVDVAALGTAAGTILLYSTLTGKDEAHLEGGHNSPVNYLTWHRGTNLFSCSDSHIVEWNINNNKIESKWKVGKERVTCILVLPDGKSLISAHQNINLWDLKTKLIVKTFTGHASPVTSLTLAGDGYLISTARDDRLLSAWLLSTKNGNKDLVASFRLNDVAKSVSVSSGGSTSPSRLAVVERSGVLQLFEHQLNGKCAKPIKPKTTLMIAMDTGQNKTSPINQIPVINANLGPAANVMISYGSGTLLSFENISCANHEKVMCLLRKDQRSQQSFVSGSKVKVPDVSENVTYVSGMAKSPHGVKRGAKGVVQSDVPMADRLHNLALTDVNASTPKAHSMVQLLVQGLASKEKTLTESVLHHKEPEIISSTISQLPIQLLPALIQELTRLLHRKSHKSLVAADWMRSVLSIHASQLLAHPELKSTFSEMLGLVESRQEVLAPLMRVRGKLDLLLEQIENGSKGEDNTDVPAVLVYQEPDSDDGSENYEMTVAGSDSEDIWDEQSIVDENSDIEIIQDEEDIDMED